MSDREIKRFRRIIYDKFDGRCAYCGQEIEIKDMQIDHIIPKKNFLMHIKNKWKIPEFLSRLTENNINHKDNLFPSCRVCNHWKDTFDIEAFRNEIECQVERLNKFYPNYRRACRYGLIKEVPNDVIFWFEKHDMNENR